MAVESPSHTRESRALASEIKFMVDPDLAARVRAWARLNLHPDPHGAGAFGDEYRTTTIYSDTDALDVFNRRRSFGRAKYRIRRYAESDVIFLERKLRQPRVLVKRRTRVPVESLSRVTDAPGEAWAGDWFQKRLAVRRLGPVCQLSYHRTARGTLENGTSARLTLDDGLRAVRVTEPRFSLDLGTAFFGDRVILELKFRASLPAIFTRLIEEFRLSPRPASKYRLGMAALGHVGASDEREAPFSRDSNA